MSDSLGVRTRSEAVAERLRRQILDGQLSSGTRLRQNEVATQFGVSTTPVREAFAALVKESLLSGDPHRGVTVATFSVDDLVENYELRIVLEALGAERAAVNAQPADIDELERMLERMHRVPRRSPRAEDEYVRLNAEFHARIYAIANRPRLCELIASLREQAAIYIRIYTHTSSQPDMVEAQHAAVVDAIRRRAPKRAAKAMRDHLEYNLEFLLAQIGKPPSRRRAA